MDFIDVFNKNEKLLDAKYNQFKNNLEYMKWLQKELQLHEALLWKEIQKFGWLIHD